MDYVYSPWVHFTKESPTEGNLERFSILILVQSLMHSECAGEIILSIGERSIRVRDSVIEPSQEKAHLDGNREMKCHVFVDNGIIFQGDFDNHT